MATAINTVAANLRQTLRAPAMLHCGSNGPGLTGDTSTLAGLASVSPKLLAAVDALPALAGAPAIDLDERWRHITT